MEDSKCLGFFLLVPHTFIPLWLGLANLTYGIGGGC